MAKLQWTTDPKENGGVTWLELYAMYLIHGGARREEEEAEKDPLRITPSLQTRLAEFKKAIRKLKKHGLKEEQEWHWDTCHVM